MAYFPERAMKRVSFQTLGCKVNFSETSTISRQFAGQGYRVVEPGEPCDVFVLNTCSVTDRTDHECRQMIRRALRHSPGAYVVVIGCYAQLQPGEIASIGGVDLVLGAKEKFNVFQHAGDFRKAEQTQIFVSCIDEPLDFVGSSSGETDGRTRAYLKVQDGCDYSCAFCTIPLARGGSRSQPVERIIASARQLVEQGYREIVLTGVNVGDYGRTHGTSLLQLLRALDDVPADRFRISSIEPNLLTTEMVDFILASKRFCNHFHIPMQSGSDAILGSMRRRYRTDQYRGLVNYIKNRDPEACIGADVLVGFPGETDELFYETKRFIEHLPVSYLHVFTYSERGQTPAAESSGSIAMPVRSRRNEILRTISRDKREAVHRRAVGSVVQVLFETPDDDSTQAGWTKNYLRVAVPCEMNLGNAMRLVHITGCDQQRCTGTLLSHQSTQTLDGALIQS